MIILAEELIKIAKMISSIEFPSRFDIGDPVMFVAKFDSPLSGHIRTVTFTNGKVRYSINLDIDNTDADGNPDPLTSTIHNVDSALIEQNPNGEKIEFDFDNYS